MVMTKTNNEVSSSACSSESFRASNKSSIHRAHLPQASALTLVLDSFNEEDDFVLRRSRPTREVGARS